MDKALHNSIASMLREHDVFETREAEHMKPHKRSIDFVLNYSKSLSVKQTKHKGAITQTLN